MHYRRSRTRTKLAQGSPWQRDVAEARIREVLDAAKSVGPQTVVDRDGSFEITFTQPTAGFEELFSKPGPLQDEDFDP